MLSTLLLPVVIMTFPMELPDANAQPAAVIIAQASSTNSTTETQAVPTVGVCTVVDISGNNGPISISPVGAAERYQNRLEKLSDWMVPPANAAVTILVSPRLGSLSETSTKGRYIYTSTSGNTGLDRAIFLVDTGSRQFKLIYFIQVYLDNGENEANCEKTYWRISRADINSDEVLPGSHHRSPTNHTDAD